MRQSLTEYTAEVNDHWRAHCAKLNEEFRAGRRLFGARHYDYTEVSVEQYWQSGLTPRQAFRQMLRQGKER